MKTLKSTLQELMRWGIIRHIRPASLDAATFSVEAQEAFNSFVCRVSETSIDLGIEGNRPEILPMSHPTFSFVSLLPCVEAEIVRVQIFNHHSKHLE